MVKPPKYVLHKTHSPLSSALHSTRKLLVNIVIPPLIFATFLTFFLPFLAFKLFLSIFRSIFSENVAGKVILIAGASSPLGKHLAYEYARRGGCLVLVAGGREDQLREVADRTRQLGSPCVMAIPADVSKVEDCKGVVDATVNYFGRLDHLVTDTGIASICKSMFEDVSDITSLASIMQMNFWSSVYSTHAAIPHLRKTKGRIIVIAPSSGRLPSPGLGLYNASRDALISLYETLRFEFGKDIGITIAAPRLIAHEISQFGAFLAKDGLTESEQEIGDVQSHLFKLDSAEAYAKAIVKSACGGKKYLTESSWMKVAFLLQVFCPKLLYWWRSSLSIARQVKLEISWKGGSGKQVMDLHGPMNYPSPGTSKQLMDLSEPKHYPSPGTIYFPKLNVPRRSWIEGARMLRSFAHAWYNSPSSTWNDSKEDMLEKTVI
ncbi:11-beta-hydroxysteroid dehydrogenase A-like isoform X2 [Malania oleifera]|uniref:11-beta-hydroxysteroid dehydrogenase A-like isoform X2 n=1 Tax=Malania oleifera TaxID=397392 RepID=UPI0025AE9B92|nr:11-beta-hydroxysteroid dehydrogenase A-like isoform X2 [Malania oleifera]